ncbi:MAG TPA: LacI family DNA-binding transcriptional regulator [Microbacterium sp.]|nr:LacI family DNA-binding transcriptional regulator [Microbacterium sp.]
MGTGAGVGIDDVARLAGVSTATVSRALRGLPEVREATRAKVRRAAAELNYVPSPSAASLASGRTRTIGLLTASFSRWFNRNVVEGAEERLRGAGYDVLLHAFDFALDGTRVPIDMSTLRQRVDGMIVLGIPLSHEERRTLDSLAVPIVFVGTGPPDHVRVSMDDHDGSRLVVEHLAALGHRSIGQIGASLPHDSHGSSAAERHDGTLEAFARLGIEHDPSLEAFGDYTLAGGRAGAAELLDAHPEMTAIFAYSDEMAFGALEELRDRGIRVPEEMSVIGIDGHELSGLIGLTTVSQDARAQGDAGATLLLEMIAGAHVGRDVRFPVALVENGSTAAPRH